MNWDAVGAIGEILGAVAVFITLIYLAVQIRQNTRQLRENEKALRRSEMNSLMQNWSDLRRAEMSDASLAEVLARAASGFETLGDADRIRIAAHRREIYWINYHLWLRVQDAIFPAAEWERARHLLIDSIRSPGGREAWERASLLFDPRFVLDIEGDVRATDVQ